MKVFYRLFLLGILIFSDLYSSEYRETSEHRDTQEEPIVQHDERYYEERTAEEREQMRRDLENQKDEARRKEEAALEEAAAAQAEIDSNASAGSTDIQQAQARKQESEKQAEEAKKRKEEADAQLRVIGQVEIRVQQAAADVASSHQKILDEKVIQVLKDVQSFNEQTAVEQRDSVKKEIETLLDLGPSLDAKLSLEQISNLQSVYFDTFVSKTISNSNTTLGELFNNPDPSKIVETKQIGELAGAIEEYGILQDSLSASLKYLSPEHVKEVQKSVVKLKTGIDIIRVSVMERVGDLIDFINNPQDAPKGALKSLTTLIRDLTSSSSPTKNKYEDIRNAIIKIYGLKMGPGDVVLIPQGKSNPVLAFYQDGLNLIIALEQEAGAGTRLESAVQKMQEKYLDERAVLKDDLAREIDELKAQIEVGGGKGSDPLADRLLTDIDRANDKNDEALRNDTARDVTRSSTVMVSKKASDILKAVKAQLDPSTGYFSTAKDSLSKMRSEIDLTIDRLDATIEALDARKKLLEDFQNRFRDTDHSWLKRSQDEYEDIMKKKAEAVADRWQLIEKKVQINDASAGVEAGVVEIIADYQKSPRTTILSQVTGIFKDAFNFIKRAFSGLKIEFFGDSKAGTLGDQITQMNKNLDTLGTAFGKTKTTLIGLIGDGKSGGSNGVLQDTIEAALAQETGEPPADPLGRKKYDQRVHYDELVQEISSTEDVYKAFQDQFAVVEKLRAALNHSRAIMEVSTSMKGKTFDGKPLEEAGSYFVIPTNPTAEDIVYLGEHILLGTTGLDESVYTEAQYRQAGQEVFDRMKGKTFNQLSFEDARPLIEMYRRREAKISGGSKSETLEGLRDLGQLMDAGGVLVWEQVKDIMAGKPDFAKLSEGDAEHASNMEKLFGPPNSGTKSLTTRINEMYAEMAQQKFYLESSLQTLYELRSIIDPNYANPVMVEYPDDDIVAGR